jgi:plastocyanin
LNHPLSVFVSHVMTATKRNAFLAGAGGLLLALATACSSSGSGGSGSSGATSPGTAAGGTTQSAPAAQAGTITIAGFAFTGPLTVSPGATVTVMNTDAADHTVTADSAGTFDVQAPAGKTVTFTAPTQPGTYDYHCSIHPNMHGKLIVK